MKFLPSSLIVVIAILLTTSCPNPANTIQQQVADPSLSPPTGTYTTIQSVAISTTTARSGDPLHNRWKHPNGWHLGRYTQPRLVCGRMKQSAVAYQSGWTESEVATAAYTISGIGPAIYAATANGLSVSTNGGANWTNYLPNNRAGNNVMYGVYVVGIDNLLSFKCWIGRFYGCGSHMDKLWKSSRISSKRCLCRWINRNMPGK